MNLRGSARCRALSAIKGISLAFLVMAVSSVSTVARDDTGPVPHILSAVPVISGFGKAARGSPFYELPVQPSADQITAARQALGQHEIVYSVGGTIDQLTSLLDIEPPPPGANQTTGSALPGGLPSPCSQLPTLGNAPPAIEYPEASRSQLGVIAARHSMRGSLHVYYGFTSSKEPHAAAVLRRRLMKWAVGEIQNDGEPQGDVPNYGAWTEISLATHEDIDPNNNALHIIIGAYRLNDIKSGVDGNDWYMVTSRPQSDPASGWQTEERLTRVGQAWPQVQPLFDYGPTGTITTMTTGFSVGASLTAGLSPGIGLSATYSESWTQPSVVTDDETSFPDRYAQWHEHFSHDTPTSQHSFFSHSAAIFQLPEYLPTSYLNLEQCAIFTHGSHWYRMEIAANPILAAPVCAVPPGELQIPPGNTCPAGGCVPLVAGIPSGGEGLSWALTNVPNFLTVSQITGSGPAALQVDALPNTTLGSMAFLNLTTSPLAGAPEVEEGPLIIPVSVTTTPTLGKVLIAGGYDASGNYLSTAETYDPSTEEFTATNNTMSAARFQPSSALLYNGQVLVAGGSSSPNAAVASADIFDPGTGYFAPTGAMEYPRTGEPGVLLQSGNVLIDGNVLVDGAQVSELYNPSLGTFSATFNGIGGGAGEDFPGLVGHQQTTLPSGRVLISGGINVGENLFQGAGELFFPSQEEFGGVIPMIQYRAYHTATLLYDGTVLITGGLTSVDGGLPPSGSTNTAEIYDPETFSFTPTGNMNYARRNHTATLLPNGKVLITGGISNAASNDVLNTAEIYDPQTGTFSVTTDEFGFQSNMNSPRQGHTATLLNNGQVLLAGGSSNDSGASALNTAEYYNPSSGYFVNTGTLLQTYMTSARYGHVAAALPVNSP